MVDWGRAGREKGGCARACGDGGINGSKHSLHLAHLEDVLLLHDLRHLVDQFFLEGYQLASPDDGVTLLGHGIGHTNGGRGCSDTS